MSRPAFIAYLVLVIALAASVVAAPSDADANAERRPFKTRVLRMPEDGDQDKARRKEQLMIMGPISMSKVVDFEPDGGKDSASAGEGDARHVQGGAPSWWNWLTAYHRCGAGERRDSLGSCREIWDSRASNRDSAATPRTQ